MFLFKFNSLYTLHANISEEKFLDSLASLQKMRDLIKKGNKLLQAEERKKERKKERKGRR